MNTDASDDQKAYLRLSEQITVDSALKILWKIDVLEEKVKAEVKWLLEIMVCEKLWVKTKL